jgi:hypothetical protein
MLTGPTEVRARPLSARSKALRLAPVAVVLVLLAWGSWKGNDEAFPVGPFVMFAFTTQTDGEVRSAELAAVTEDGHRFFVALEPEEIGLRRAEIEGQLDKLEHQPQLLGEIAGAAARLHPDRPRWRQLDLMQHVIQLRHGRAVSQSDVVLASWHQELGS